MAPPPEIAIPSTSVSDEGASKPYTLYNITLRLPLRSFVVQKRYSDFAALHSALVEQVGASPPESLPGKHWLKSTVRSADLTRQRQVGLEKYLRTIAETPDRRWRDTSAWRTFLNLPSTSSTANSAVSASGMVRPAPAGSADAQTWLDMHRDLKHALQEARQCLSRRDAAASDSGNSTTATAEAASSAKKVLLRAGTLVSALSDGLRKMQESNRLGDGELRRRRDLVSAARMERDALEKLSNSMPNSSSSISAAAVGGGGTSNATTAEKAALLKGGRPAGGRVLGAPLPETAKTRELDNQGILLLQKKELAAQDSSLDQLSTIIRRQKEIGLQIKDEVDAQSEMLQHLDEDVDRVNGKLRVANNRIKRL
ncbi:SNARE complex subunit [Moelleriella libera RCEF 2490]|uniref:SNARE complex subunit n=1 Tax=Moelleriella libera RCEF 2490 TaxID=1081109 RepID=A0A167YUE3_9HYPO|nr:SNARE complex subunit [Moelleriella libera RCEF 2490]